MIARLCFAAAAGLACAQSSDKLEIRGTVVEKGVGIAGVTATLFQFGTDAAHEITRNVFATAFTDSKGAFVIHPSRSGEYYLEVNKEGYFAESFDGPGADPMDSTGDPVSLDQDHPSQERRFALMRLGEIHGRVIDEDGKPLTKLHIWIRPGTSTQVVTDQDGYFAATKLRPGNYVVRIGPQHSAIEIQPQFSSEDLKAVDQDLETSFWPSAPLPISAGVSLSVGTITARKSLYYRAHLSVQSGDCAPGEKWNFSAIPELPGLGQTVPCGKEFLVKHLPPGSYSFALSTNGRPGEKREWAVATGEVTDHNLEVALTMSPGTDISGRMIGAEGVTLPPLKAMLMIFAGPAQLTTGAASLDAAGNFRISGRPGERSRISVIGLGDKFYVKEIRYNSLIAADGAFTPLAGSPTILEIVVDDNAGTIGGSVDGYEQVSGRVAAVAVKWPLPPEVSASNVLLASANSTADDKGRFKIGGLAPGEYRVFAMTDDLRRALGTEELTRVLNRAEKVTVERGSSQSVSLKIVEP